MAYTPDQIKTYVDQLVAGGGGMGDIMSAARQYGVPYADVGAAYGMNPMDTLNYAGSNGVRQANVGEFGVSPTDWLASTGRGLDPRNPGGVNGTYTLPGGYSWDGSLQYSDSLGQWTPYVDAPPRWMGQMGGMGGGQQQAAPTTPSATEDPLAKYFSYTPSEGLQGLLDSITGQYNDNLMQTILPSIRSDYRGMGAAGGSRQGIAEANAITGSNKALADALTGAGYTDYTNAMNRGLTRYQADHNFYNTGRGLDLSTVELGANLYNTGMLGPWGQLTAANGIFSPYSGLGTQTSSASSGGGTGGLLGGALAGMGLAGQAGLWKGW